MRSDIPMWDFASVYSASRTWLHGGNPYDLPAVVATWRHEGVFSRRSASTWATVYPPTSLLMLVPLALLPAGVAMVAWLVITLALLGLQFAALIDLAGLRRHDPRALILVGAALASAPLQFGILSGQLSLPAISACVIAFWCAGRGRDRLAGVFIGLACAVKPQVAAPFVVYYLVLRRRTVARSAVLYGMLICAVALAGMALSHINWIAGWSQSITASRQFGGVNDYGWADQFRDEIIDLKILLVSIPLDPLVLRVVIECIVLALLAWYVQAFPRGRERSDRDELLSLAALSALSLLLVYHRAYDATLLTTALAWALAELDGPRRGYAVALLVPMAVFLIPFDIVESVGYRLPGMVALAQTWWWQSLIAPHYAWGLVALTLALLMTMSRQATARASI